MLKDDMRKFLIIVVAAAIFIYGATVVFHDTFSEPEPAEELVACTADAMQCADGSWVGRTGPNCEFVCPE